MADIDESRTHEINEFELFKIHELTDLTFIESAEDMQNNLEKIRDILETKFNFLDFNQ